MTGPHRIPVRSATSSWAVADRVPATRQHALPTPAPLILEPDRLPRRFTVTVLGDVRVDLRVRLRQSRFADLSSDHDERVPIETGLGGTALSFARHGMAHFADIRVVAAVGCDEWTTRIEGALARLGCGGLLHVVDRPNSPVVIVRDRGSDDCPDGTRLLVANPDSTYAHLDQGVVEAAGEHLLESDALVVDGYALLAPGSSAGLHAATALACAVGIPIAFDIVPHGIDEAVPLTAMRDVIRRASLVSVEAPTLLRLLGLPVPGTIRADDVVQLVEQLPGDLAGPTRTWFVRFGQGLADRTVAMSAGHHRVTYATGYAEADDVAGYGYRIAAAELKWWLTNLARATRAYPGVALGWRVRKPLSS